MHKLVNLSVHQFTADKISLRILNKLTDPVLVKGSGCISPHNMMMLTVLREKVWSRERHVMNKDCAKIPGTDKTHRTFIPTLWRDVNGHKKYATSVVMTSLTYKKL